MTGILASVSKYSPGSEPKTDRSVMNLYESRRQPQTLSVRLVIFRIRFVKLFPSSSSMPIPLSRIFSTISPFSGTEPRRLSAFRPDCERYCWPSDSIRAPVGSDFCPQIPQSLQPPLISVSIGKSFILFSLIKSISASQKDRRRFPP